MVDLVDRLSSAPASNAIPLQFSTSSSFLRDKIVFITCTLFRSLSLHWLALLGRPALVSLFHQSIRTVHFAIHRSYRKRVSNRCDYSNVARPEVMHVLERRIVSMKAIKLFRFWSVQNTILSIRQDAYSNMIYLWSSRARFHRRTTEVAIAIRIVWWCHHSYQGIALTKIVVHYLRWVDQIQMFIVKIVLTANNLKILLPHFRVVLVGGKGIENWSRIDYRLAYCNYPLEQVTKWKISGHDLMWNVMAGERFRKLSTKEALKR